jgi:hypothetical protein
MRLGNIKRWPLPPIALSALGLPLLMAIKLPFMKLHFYGCASAIQQRPCKMVTGKSPSFDRFCHSDCRYEPIGRKLAAFLWCQNPILYCFRYRANTLSLLSFLCTIFKKICYNKIDAYNNNNKIRTIKCYTIAFIVFFC